MIPIVLNHNHDDSIGLISVVNGKTILALNRLVPADKLFEAFNGGLQILEHGINNNNEYCIKKAVIHELTIDL